MKRCPQCEFIYEDDQKCCDMDGIDLVFAQPTTSVALTKTDSPVKKRNLRRSALLSIFAVIFGVLVLAIGYASLERAFMASVEPVSTSAATPQAQKEVNVISQPVEPAPIVGAAAVDPASSAVVDKTKTASIVARESSRGMLEPNTKGREPLQRNSLGTRGVVLGTIPPQNRIDSSSSQREMVTRTSPAKKDPKVVSLVKKTGRLLTKPFKL